MVREVKEGLIKRYMYLYENKELILSLGINKAIEVERINKEIKKWVKSKEDLEKYKYVYEDMFDNLIQLIDVLITDYQKLLKEPKYYLFDKIDMNLVMMFEEFVLGDLNIENTRLYNYIEKIKNTPELLDDANMKIDGLMERRSVNYFLKDRDVFTVWRILTYVRNNNLDNDMVLRVLDKYYNLDRYIGTGINFNSGYYWLETDGDIEDEYLNNVYNNSIIGGVRTNYEYSMIIVGYDGNEFEKEDDYRMFEREEECCKKKFRINKKSRFMKKILLDGMLSIEDKQDLYCKIHSVDLKILKRKK